MPEASLVHITPANWKWRLKISKPDLLFVESAWRGYKNSWQRKIACYPDSLSVKPELEKLIGWCRQQKIPTVFWNKEDPFHFNRFKSAAALFDYVYTTDAGSLELYSSIENKQFHFVNTLPFAAQPSLHRPDNLVIRTPKVVFLGGYYGEEFPERSRKQLEVLSALCNKNLIIYDRFWTKKRQCSFPRALHQYCRPAIDQKAVAIAYRRFQLYLNFNSIVNSPTMLSRRVFELAASGSPMLSTPSKAMKKYFGDVIPAISNGIEAVSWADQFLNDKNLRFSVSKQLRDIVMGSHTWKHRLKQIGEETGAF